MIITALRNWDPEPGELVEWQPTDAALRAAATAAADPDPGTFLQDNHLRGVHARARSGQPHTAYLAVTTEVDGGLDATAMSRALTRFARRHSGLLTWFDTDGATVTRHSVAPARIDFEAMTIGHTPGGAEFRDHALVRIARDAVATSWPGFVLGAIARPGSFTLYYATDHALSDGASQALVLTELLDFYGNETTACPLSPFTATPAGGFPDYAREENARAHQFSPASPEVAEWVEIFRDHDNAMPRFALDLGLTPGATAPMHGIEFDVLDRAGSAAFAEVCRAAGGRYVAGVLAAVAITDLELAGRTDYYGMTVLSTRGVGEFLLTQGWLCNFAPVTFSLAGCASFTEVVGRANAAYDRAIRLSTVPLSAVLTALLSAGADPAAVTASPNMLSYLDFRRFPGAGTAPYERGMLFTGEGETANASMWFNRDAEHLYLGCQSPATPFAQHQLARYHAHLRSVFDAVATDGDRGLEADDREVAVARHHG
ncbi:condensation domain-containing protein [Nocardia sp. NPDC050413]|uniref:condensation domain-containing protein n=1 Tax=Nocardia sp. NPDC050413 TaxID=3155784 RepID=UPI0033DF56FC